MHIWFTYEFSQTFKEQIPPNYNIFSRKTLRGNIPNSFYKTRITLIPKPYKGIIKQRKKNKQTTS